MPVSTVLTFFRDFDYVLLEAELTTHLPKSVLKRRVEEFARMVDFGE